MYKLCFAKKLHLSFSASNSIEKFKKPHDLCTTDYLLPLISWIKNIYHYADLVYEHNLGGTQVWTGDPSICSRKLYHWAIPMEI